MTDFFFVAFALVFFLTRLVVFPFHIFLHNSVRINAMQFGCSDAVTDNQKGRKDARFLLPHLPT